MRWIKKSFALLIILVLATGSALADRLSRSYIPCDCIGHCVCFIQKDDEGNFVKAIIKELIKKNYLPKKTPTGLFTEDVEKAVKQFQSDHQLEQTGMMDDDTLTILLWNMTPNELDKTTTDKKAHMTVYIPTNVGKRRHKSPSCSGMISPRKVSIRNAEKAGFDTCGRNGCGDPP